MSVVARDASFDWLELRAFVLALGLPDPATRELAKRLRPADEDERRAFLLGYELSQFAISVAPPVGKLPPMKPYEVRSLFTMGEYLASWDDWGCGWLGSLTGDLGLAEDACEAFAGEIDSWSPGERVHFVVGLGVARAALLDNNPAPLPTSSQHRNPPASGAGDVVRRLSERRERRPATKASRG